MKTAQPSKPDLDVGLASLLERERTLRGLLLDARDTLVRNRLWPAGPARRPSSPRPQQASSGEGREPPGYAELRTRLRTLLESTLPPEARALVISRGDRRLLDLGSSGTGQHFPDDGYGEYLGHHPADSAAAIRQLERQRRRGAGFLVFPATARWWLQHYQAFAEHLAGRYRKLADEPSTGVVYDLREPTSAESEDRADQRRSPRSPSRPLAAVTIISRNYLAQARVLARSFLEHEPRGRFYLLIIDRLPPDVEVGVEVTTLDPGELEIPSFYEMCFKYGVIELATAVKPFVLSHLFQEFGEEDVVFFDPDILVTRPLTELRKALDVGDIVLTPHITRPLPLDGKRPTEPDIMISGAYNLGFIALRRSQETERFLGWWEERLQDGCRIDVPHGLFTDQKWIDLVPSLFPSTVILRDPTYNVAFWNLHERTISLEDGSFHVNGRPATFFHISGFDPAHPDRLSKHQTRTEVKPGSALAFLLERYGSLLIANGYEESSRWSYGYEQFENGFRVHPLLRQLYLNLSPAERRRFGNPFSTKQADSFLAWATRPSNGNGELSRFLETIYRVRYDLPVAFPDVHGRDRAAFLRWARRWGSAEMGYDAALVQESQPGPGSPPKPAAAGKRRAGASAAAPMTPPPGRKSEPRGRASGPAGPSPGAVTRAIAQPAPAGTGAASYATVVERIRNVARGLLPAGSRVLVISKGDYRLVDLDGCEGWHFPQTEDGVYGGYYPADSEVAIAHLEKLRGRGAGYLLVPQSSFWWLEYYDGFRDHLEQRYRLVARDNDSCLIYSLRGSQDGAEQPSVDLPRRWRWWSRLRSASLTTFANARRAVQ